MRSCATIDNAGEFSGKKVVPMELDRKAFDETKDAPYPGADEMYLNLEFFVKNGPDSGFRSKEAQENTWKLFPGATTWQKLVELYKHVLFP